MRKNSSSVARRNADVWTAIELRRLDYSLTDRPRGVCRPRTAISSRRTVRSKQFAPQRNPASTKTCGSGCAPWARRRWRCPESAGGDGATLVDLTLVAEEIGRSLAPVPWIDHVCTARLLARLARRNPMSCTASGSPHSIRSTTARAELGSSPPGRSPTRSSCATATDVVAADVRHPPDEGRQHRPAADGLGGSGDRRHPHGRWPADPMR